MDTSKMVVVRDKRVVVEVRSDEWYELDPARSQQCAEYDANKVGLAIAFAVEQHAAEEATSDGLTVTFPFKLGQRVLAVASQVVATVTKMTIEEGGAIWVTCVGDSKTPWVPYLASEFEAIPKTALEVLEELNTCAADTPVGLPITYRNRILSKIAELQRELKEPPAADEQRKET